MRDRSGRCLAAAFGLAAALLGGCGAEPVEQWPPAKIYTVRGEIRSLPAPDRPRAPLSIRHEAIPDFIGILGEPEPMDSMTMQFAVGEGVDTTALAVGDKVEFQLEVDWSADDRARVVAIEPLPPETVLRFGPADPESTAH